MPEINKAYADLNSLFVVIGVVVVVVGVVVVLVVAVVRLLWLLWFRVAVAAAVPVNVRPMMIHCFCIDSDCEGCKGTRFSLSKPSSHKTGSNICRIVGPRLRISLHHCSPHPESIGEV